ncbi:MAG: hypothetical protein CL946_11140 [Ectothiorhodospiraceae bacterium]|nr:hypothetical protein [Ectothiorhodospiraceae bacterium]
MQAYPFLLSCRMNRLTTLLSDFSSQYNVLERRFQINDRTLTIISPADINDLIEKISSKQFIIDERLPYWAEVWHSGIALAKTIDSCPALVEGKDILDMGCGLGITGVIAGLYADKVTFADYEPDALIASEINALKNGIVTEAAYECLDFRQPPGRKWEVVIAADVVYEKRFREPLLKFFSEAVADSGIILITEPNRTVATGFFDDAVEAGFTRKSSTMSAVMNENYVDVSVHLLSKDAAALEGFIVEGEGFTHV